MFNFMIGLVLVIALGTLYLFYTEFTKRGAIPLAKAWRDFTSWLSLAGLMLGNYVVELLRWFADLWEPVQVQFGSLLSDPSLVTFVQLMSFVFMALKLKGQTPLPKPSLPDFPEA